MFREFSTHIGFPVCMEIPGIIPVALFTSFCDNTDNTSVILLTFIYSQQWYPPDSYLQPTVLNSFQCVISSYRLLLTPTLILELVALLFYLQPGRRYHYQFWYHYDYCLIYSQFVDTITNSGIITTSFCRPSDFALEKVSPFGCSGWESSSLGLECIMWWSVTHAVIRGVERAIWGRSGELR